MSLLDLNHLKNKYSLDIKTIAHIGAHRGQEVEEYLNLFPNAVIYLFEPQKKLFNFLKKNFAILDNVTLYNFGLGSSNSTLDMHISDNDGQSSSFLKPKEHLNEHPGIKFYDKTEIYNIKVLDDLGLSKIDFLNIDTQGFELEVLKGSETSLKADVNYIITEVNKMELYEGCPTVKDIDNFLKKFGFIRTDTHYWMDKASWGDAFYIKKNLVSTRRVLFSMLKNYLYGKKYLYNLLLTIRNTIWKLVKKTS